LSKRAIIYATGSIAACIAAGAVIIAAVIGLLQCRGGGHKIGTINQEKSQAWITGDVIGENVTINYTVPETATKEAIGVLEKKVNDVNAAVELNREEVRLLARALKDLDQRTSGIEKLPDGRTKFGNFVTGTPTILLGEHNASIREFKQHNFQAAFEHSKRAIELFEQFANIPGIKTGELSNENAAKLYYQGSLSAYRANMKDLAREWIQKAIDKHKTIEKEKLLVVILIDLGKSEKALEIVKQLRVEHPNDKELVRIEEKVSSALEKRN
jgi:tetratricopeptide (TPR) repeat protein